MPSKHFGDAISGLGERQGGAGAGLHSAKDRGDGHRHQHGTFKPFQGISRLTNHHRNQPRFCIACRGEHGTKKSAHCTSFTPKERLENLHKLQTKFEVAFWRGTLPCAFDNSRRDIVKWRKREDGTKLIPQNMTKEEYCEYLPLMFEGAREGHHSHHLLATEAANQLLRFGKRKCLAAIPKLVFPIRLCLQTKQPELGGHMLVLIQRLLQSHHTIGPALVPFYKRILPPILEYKNMQVTVTIPPSACVPRTGNAAGHPSLGQRTCNVCGKPVNKAAAIELSRQRWKQAKRMHGHKDCGQEPSPHREGLTLDRRFSQNYLLKDLVIETVDKMARFGGSEGIREIKKTIPTFDFVE